MNQSEKGGITINFSTGAIIRVLLFIVLLEVLYLLSDLVLIILTSVVIASAIEPAAKRLAKHRVPRRTHGVLNGFGLDRRTVLSRGAVCGKRISGNP